MEAHRLLHRLNGAEGRIDSRARRHAAALHLNFHQRAQERPGAARFT